MHARLLVSSAVVGRLETWTQRSEESRGAVELPCPVWGVDEMPDSTPHERGDNDRQLAASELRRLGLRVPCLKTAAVASAKQVTLSGWPLFGVDIAEQPQQASHLVPGLIVPWFLDESLRALLSHASTEGILRKSGSLSRQRLLRTSLESSASLGVASVVLASAPIHDVSGLLKQWLQLLPEPLLPKPLVQLLLRCQAKHGLESVLLGLRLLPDERLACLRHLLSGLAHLAADPGNLMGAHNLATVLAPTLCCPATMQSATREDLDSVVSLVQALIEASHLVGSTPPPLPGRAGRKKTNSACLLLHQLRRLVVQRKVPEAEAADGQDCSPVVAPDGPALGSKRRKPRELLPRGLSPWKRAKREEGVPSRQQQANTPELLEGRPHQVTPSVTLQVQEQSAVKPRDTEAAAATSVMSSGAATFYAEKPAAHLSQPVAVPVDPLVPQTVHFLRGSSCTSSTKSSLRRGRPNSLRTGLPSPRPLRHGPGARRHSSTGSKPRPPVGKENLQRSLRYASQVDSVFNAPAMAHLAAIKARKEAFMAQCLEKNPTLFLDVASPQLHRGSSAVTTRCSSLEPVVEAPPVLPKEPQLPAQGQDGAPSSTEENQEEDEPMDVDVSCTAAPTDGTTVETPPLQETTPSLQETTPPLQETTSPLQETTPNAAIACEPRDEATVTNEGQEQTTAIPSVTLTSSAPTIKGTQSMAEPAVWSDSFFALPAVPPEPASSAAKRESIIQIRERNAGMVRSSVEVFNRAAAASSTVVRSSGPAVRTRRAVAGRSAPVRKGSDPTSSRSPLREANFRAPASPRARTRQEQQRRDWEMEL
ncbi:uncharacterized protein LOC144103214 isoform X2 [Amblyomma americanum]